MRKGAQMYTVREFTKDKAGMANTLKKIKAIGYDSIQTGTPSYLTNVEFKAMLDEAGLTDCSAGGNYGLMVSDPKAGIGAAIEQAHVFGVNYVEVGTLPQEWRESEEGYKLYAASLNKIAAELKKKVRGFCTILMRLNFTLLEMVKRDLISSSMKLILRA